MPLALFVGAGVAWFAVWLWPSGIPQPELVSSPAMNDFLPDDPSLVGDMLRDMASWLGWRLAEALGWALAFWVVSLQSRSLEFGDYFGHRAAIIGLSAGAGWFVRTLAPSDHDDWQVQAARQLGLLMIFVAFFAAIVEMAWVGFFAFALLVPMFALRRPIWQRGSH
jgi:hypothetical protein